MTAQFDLSAPSAARFADLLPVQVILACAVVAFACLTLADVTVWHPLTSSSLVISLSPRLSPFVGDLMGIGATGYLGYIFVETLRRETVALILDGNGARLLDLRGQTKFAYSWSDQRLTVFVMDIRARTIGRSVPYAAETWLTDRFGICIASLTADACEALLAAARSHGRVSANYIAPFYFGFIGGTWGPVPGGSWIRLTPKVPIMELSPRPPAF